MRRGQLVLAFTVFTLAEICTGQAFTKACGLLTPPTNGLITGCTKGSLKGSRCTIRCKYGFRQEQTTRFCSCLNVFCLWEGSNPPCNVRECQEPDNEHGKVTIVDKWPRGFAALIEFRNVQPVLHEGWSVVLKFDRSLGPNAELSSWSSEPTSVSPGYDAFTLSNIRYGSNSTLSSSSNLRTLFVVTGVAGEAPTRGYLGMYDRRITDATCFEPDSQMPEIDVLPAFAVSSLATTMEIPTTATTAATITEKLASEEPTTAAKTPTTATQPTTSAQSETTSESNKEEVEETTENESKEEVEEVEEDNLPLTTRSTSTEARTEASLSQPFLTTVDEMPCIFQRGNITYRTQQGWIDRDRYYFSGNAIANASTTTTDWLVVVIFSKGIRNLQVWNTAIVGNESDGCLWKLGPKHHNIRLHPGILDINFIAELIDPSNSNPAADIYLCSRQFTKGDPIRLPVDGVIEPPLPGNETSPLVFATVATTSTVSTPPSSVPPKGPKPSLGASARCQPSAPMGQSSKSTRQSRPRWKRSRDATKYNYNEVLVKSILFYEVQRSGVLPKGRYKRVPWRGNAMMKDGCPIGVDLSRGWFDAGDHVKFTFPAASAVTVLAWGAIEYRSAYIDAGIITRFLGSFKWPVEWLIKAHTAPNELVALVGNIKADHGYWGRPEEWNQERPVFKVTTAKPGSEVAAETVAALASASMVLKKSHRSIAVDALAHARQLYDFATNHRGNYHESIPEVMQYYRSWSGDEDELIWAAIWLYKATSEERYLNDARSLFTLASGQYLTEAEFSWDRKMIGAQVLLANITGDRAYRASVERFMIKVMRDTTKTPQGMIWVRQHAPNRYAANAAFIALMAYNLEPPLPNRELYKEFAQTQIHLLLGDAGRSYVIGFGRNFPRKPHHRSSSCPPLPAACYRQRHYFSPQPNHYIIYGALVGGPDRLGNYEDNRENYAQSEVAVDYNAGFQSAVAGLKFHAMKSRPNPPSPARRTT